MIRFQKLLLFAVLCYLTFLMLFFPTVSITAAREAMDLCQSTVIPSLFPFFVCSHLLIRLGVANRLGRFLSPVMRPLFGIGGSGAVALVLGLVSGYPVGASCAASLYQRGSCTKEEAERLLAFCNNAGPMFVMGAVGIGMLNSREAGALLYGIHLFSALLTGLFLRQKPTTGPILSLPSAALCTSPWAAVGESVFHGVTSIAKVCGFVIFFSVLTAPLSHTPWGYALYPFLEITGGIAAMAPRVSSALCLPLISFFLAFSGISVFLQVASIALPVGLSLKPFFLGKTLQALLSFALTYLLQPFCIPVPVAKTAFASFLSAASFFSFAGKGFLLWLIPLSAALLWTFLHKKNSD